MSSATEQPKLQINVNSACVEFLHSIFDSTPMRTMEEIETCLRCHPVTKEALQGFQKSKQELFEKHAVLLPKGNVGKGGGKVKRGDMAHQIPEEKKEQYQEDFLALANAPVTVAFEERDIETLKKWITPEWLIDRIERFHSANGFDNVTYQKVFVQTVYALQDAQPYEAPADTETQGEEGGDTAAE